TGYRLRFTGLDTALSLRLPAPGKMGVGKRYVPQTWSFDAGGDYGVPELPRRVVEGDLVDEEVGVAVDEEEEVVDLVTGGEGRVLAVVAAAVAREIDVDEAPLAGLQVLQADVTVVSIADVEQLRRERGRPGQVIPEAQPGAFADRAGRLDLEPDPLALAVLLGDRP